MLVSLSHSVTFTISLWGIIRENYTFINIIVLQGFIALVSFLYEFVVDDEFDVLKGISLKEVTFIL